MTTDLTVIASKLSPKKDLNELLSGVKKIERVDKALVILLDSSGFVSKKAGRVVI